jgi:hypothetical protein
MQAGELPPDDARRLALIDHERPNGHSTLLKRQAQSVRDAGMRAPD